MDYVPILRFNASQYGSQVTLSVALVITLAGLITLLYGWRLFKIVVVAATALAGAYLGWYLAHGYGLLPEKWQFAGPLALGLVGAIAAIPLQKAAMFFIGSSVGFVCVGPIAAELIWKPPTGPTTTEYLVASVIAFVAMGLLAVLLFRPMVIVATSMFGATLVLSGGAQVAQLYWLKEQDVYASYGLQIAGVFGILTVLGAVFQTTTSKKKKEEA